MKVCWEEYHSFIRSGEVKILYCNNGKYQVALYLNQLEVAKKEVDTLEEAQEVLIELERKLLSAEKIPMCPQCHIPLEYDEILSEELDKALFRCSKCGLVYPDYKIYWVWEWEVDLDAFHRR